MAEYSELIKKFDKIRDYMRDFYVYGFKTRNDISRKSYRSYDNEKRRIQSYLNEYMSFYMDEKGKNNFISVDSAAIEGNPLYRAFKAKTFTKNDITLNFIILDILSNFQDLSINMIAIKIEEEYLIYFDEPIFLDLSTVRNKVKEYEKIGLIVGKKHKNQILYNICVDDVDLINFYDVLSFFSEISPMGVVGSYLLDKYDHHESNFSYKHHYIMGALDSEIIEDLLIAMHGKKKIEITDFSPHKGKEIKNIVTPLKILISVTTGRGYVACKKDNSNDFVNLRIDYIKSIICLNKDEKFDENQTIINELLSHSWGISNSGYPNLETIKLTLKIKSNEEYVLKRIQREGRNGFVTKIIDDIYIYEIRVYDAREMLPFIRTFIGRIIDFNCSNKQIERIFYSDLKKLYNLY
ncbi:MAG: WYL domain-containing protein, partial [Erysipelotrichaceae bacterium]